MTKSELIERIAQDAGLTKGRAEMVVNTIFDSMVEAMVQDEGIEIRGFGSFTVRRYKAYEGRNPRTGEVVHSERPFKSTGSSQVSAMSCRANESSRASCTCVTTATRV